jgi:hypothetical protein
VINSRNLSAETDQAQTPGELVKLGIDLAELIETLATPARGR